MTAVPAAAAAGRPLVTHFLYAYRQERTVREAIESVLAQTYEPLEIILSDDASPDGTFAVMEAAAAAYQGPHRVVLNRNPTNLGISRHVERIMELVTGDFVIESGGDDVSLPHRDARLVEAWLASGRRAHAVHSEKRNIAEDGTLLPFRPRPDSIVDIAPIDMIRRKKYSVYGATMGWSRAVYDRFGPISDLAAFHDFPICFRALLLGEVRFIEEPLVHYRRGGVSMDKEERLGWRFFYGDWIKYMRWDVQFYRVYLRDMACVAPPEAALCERLCRQTIDRFEHILSLADAGYGGRLARLPEALRLAMRHGDPGFVRTNLKYLIDRPLMRYMDWREARVLRRLADGPPKV